METPCGHGGAVGWSVTLGSILMLAVPEKRAQLPTLFSLLRMGAFVTDNLFQSDLGYPGVYGAKR